MDCFEDSSDDSTYKNGILIYFKKDGSKVPTPYVLPDGITTIGASIGNDIRIKLNDTRIQNVHCVIEVNESGIATIINKANKHPVTVNQTIVKHSKILRNDDIIEVVGKRFQYKNDYLTDQDIDAAIEKLSTLNKYSKKSSIPKSAIPRIVSLRKPPVVSKSTPISAISKRRLSLQVAHHSNFYSPAGKYNSPKASVSNAPITHSKIPKLLEAPLRKSSSPIKEYTTSEMDTEDDVFIQTVSKNTSKLGDLSSLEYLLEDVNKSMTDSEATKQLVLNSSPYKVNKHSKRFSSRKSLPNKESRVSGVTKPAKRNKSFTLSKTNSSGSGGRKSNVSEIRSSNVRRSIRKSESLTVAIEEILHHNESVTKTVEKLESKEVFVEMENGSFQMTSSRRSRQHRNFSPQYKEKSRRSAAANSSRISDYDISLVETTMNGGSTAEASFTSSRVSSDKNFSSSKTNKSQDEDYNEAEASFPSPTSTTGSRTNLPAAEYGSDDSEKSTSENFEYDDAEVSFSSNRTSVSIRSGRSMQRIETDQPENEDESNPETNVRPIKKSSIRQSNRTASEDVVKKFGLKNLPQLVVDDFLRVMADCDQSTNSNMSTHYSPISVSSLRRFQSGESEAEASPATKKAQNRSQARSTVDKNQQSEDLDTNDSDALEETKVSFSSSKENRSQVRKSTSRRSTVNKNLSENEDFDRSDAEVVVSPTRVSSGKKSVQNRSQISSTKSTDTSLSETTDASLTLAISMSQDDSEEEEVDLTATRVSSARKSAQNKSQIGSGRSTVNKNQSEVKDFGESEADVEVSPTRASSVRKSAQNRSQIVSRVSTVNKNQSEVEYFNKPDAEVDVSQTRASSARKSAQNRSQVRKSASRISTVNKNQSEDEDFDETDTDIDVSPTRSSQNRSKTVSKRSPVNKSTLRDYDTVDLNNSQDEDINEAETGISSTRTSSTRKTTHNKSRTSTTVSKKSDFEQSDLEVSLKPRKRSQVRKTVSTSAAEVNNSSISDYDELFAGMTTTESTITNKSHDDLYEISGIEKISSPMSVSSVRKTGSDSVVVIEDTLSPIRSSSARKMQSTSRNNLTQSTFDVSTIRISENAQTLDGTTIRVERTRPNISHVHTPGVRRRSADDSVDLSRSQFDQNLSPSKMSSVRKSKPSPNVRRSSRPGRSTLIEDYHYGSITNEDDATTADKYNSTTIPLNANKLVQFDESKLQVRRSSRPRRSTFNEDYLYGSFFIDSGSNEDNATATNKYNSTTIPLEQEKTKTPGKSTVEVSPRGRRNQSTPYQPITEDITPGTPPVDDSKMGLHFKTPLNTPQLFQDIRKSVLRSRLKKSLSETSKSPIRARESTSSTSGSNKRIKLPENNSSSFGSFTTDEAFGEVDVNDTSNKPKHIVDLSEKPVITYPMTRFSDGFPQKKPQEVRVSLPNRMFSSLDVSETVSQEEPVKQTKKVQKSPKNDLTKIPNLRKIMSPKVQNSPNNDLSDVRGVKKLMRTPKVQKPPANDLSDVEGVSNIFNVSTNRMFSSLDVSETVSQEEPVKQTKKVQKSPKNDLTKIPNLRKIMSPKVRNSPNNDLSDVRGVKKLMRTPKVQKTPANDLSDVEGVSNIFNVSTSHRLSNASDIENNEDLFDRIFNKKAVKTYRSKSISPVKTLNAFGNIRKSLGNLLEVNPRVLNWIKEQETLTERVNDQLKKKNRKEDVQYAALSSTKRGAVNETPKNGDESDSESPKIKKNVVRRGRSKKDIEKVEDVEEKVQRGRKKVVKETLTKVDSPKPVRGRRKPIEKIEEIVEESADSPKSVTGRRRPVEEIEESVDSPRPVRGKRNIAKKIKEIAEDTERNHQKPKNLEEIEKTVEEPAADSPKPVRGRRRPAAKKLEEIEKTPLVDSPKPRGRRQATKIVEEIKKTDEDVVADSPKPVRGRRNAAKSIKETDKVEDIATDSPKPVKGRRNAAKSNKDIEMVEDIATDSPKTVRGRRNPVKSIKETEMVEDIAADSPKPVKGRRKTAKNIEETAKTVEEIVTDSPKPVRGRTKRAIEQLPANRRRRVKKTEDTSEDSSELAEESTERTGVDVEAKPEEATSSKRPLKKIEEESKSSNKEATELKKRGRRAEETDDEGQQPVKKVKRGKKAIEEDEDWSDEEVQKESKKQGRKVEETDDEGQQSMKKVKRGKKAIEEEWNDLETKKKTARNRKEERKVKEDEVDEEEQQKPAKRSTRGRKVVEEDKMVDDDKKTAKKSTRGRKCVKKDEEMEDSNEDKQPAKKVGRKESVDEEPAKKSTRGRKTAKIEEDSSEDRSQPAKSTRGKRTVKKDEELDVLEPVEVSTARSTRRKRVHFKI